MLKQNLNVILSSIYFFQYKRYKLVDEVVLFVKLFFIRFTMKLYIHVMRD